jgi:vacuolar-type H+-ATPase subunit H
MSTQVVRIQSFTKGSLGNILNEIDRKEGINYRNSDITPEYSDLNYSFKNADEQGGVATFKRILEDFGINEFKAKKNTSAFEGMVITADTEFFENLGWVKGEPAPKAVEDFFQKAYEWALTQIGFNGTDKNILSAKVHYDETTPHLQLDYVPIVDKYKTKVYEIDTETGKIKRKENGTPIQAKDENGKTRFEQVNGVPKVSKSDFWRLRGGKDSYRRMQDSFHEVIGKAYGLERGEIGSKKKHMDTPIYKKIKRHAQNEADGILRHAKEEESNIITKAEETAQQAVQSRLNAFEQELANEEYKIPKEVKVKNPMLSKRTVYNNYDKDEADKTVKAANTSTVIIKHKNEELENLRQQNEIAQRNLREKEQELLKEKQENQEKSQALRYYKQENARLDGARQREELTQIAKTVENLYKATKNWDLVYTKACEKHGENKVYKYVAVDNSNSTRSELCQDWGRKALLKEINMYCFPNFKSNLTDKQLNEFTRTLVKYRANRRYYQEQDENESQSYTKKLGRR